MGAIKAIHAAESAETVLRTLKYLDKVVDTMWQTAKGHEQQIQRNLRADSP
jgi:hypothetical protein